MGLPTLIKLAKLSLAVPYYHAACDLHNEFARVSTVYSSNELIRVNPVSEFPAKHFSSISHKSQLIQDKRKEPEKQNVRKPDRCEMTQILNRVTVLYIITNTNTKRHL